MLPDPTFVSSKGKSMNFNEKQISSIFRNVGLIPVKRIVDTFEITDHSLLQLRAKLRARMQCRPAATRVYYCFDTVEIGGVSNYRVRFHFD